MTRVTGSTEIVKRHHLMTPIENGVFGDLQDLVAMVDNRLPQGVDDRARLIPDDEYVHLVWEEVVDKDYESDLDEWTRFAVHDLDHGTLVQVVDSIKRWRKEGKE